MNFKNQPFKELESSQRHWEVVAAARDLAKHFQEHNGNIDESDKAYQKKIERLSKALRAQSFKEKKGTTRYIQRQIVSGSLEAGTLYYVERRFMKATKAFRSAYQTLSEKERADYKISPAVSPINGQKLMNALDQKSSDPQILQIFMEFKSLLSDLGWDQKSQRPQKPQPQKTQQKAENFSKSDKKKNLIDEKMNSEIAGLGLPRNIAKKLSKSFGSVEKLKNASDEEISSIPGVGKKTLKEIRASF